MKKPRYLIRTHQEASDAGINPFAFSLLAESFSDIPLRFGDENAILVFHDHAERPVYFILTKTMPTEKDFDQEPEKTPAAPMPTTREEAAEFFARYGGVGGAEDLLRVVPTKPQLDEACRSAVVRGQPGEVVGAARLLIEGGQS